MKLSQLGEIEIIERIISVLGEDSHSIEVGPGDDAAVFKLDDELFLLITTDLLIEDVHFWKERISPEDLGYKAGAVNISDIAAMAGYPLYLIIGLGLEKNSEAKYIDRFYQGLKEICQKHETKIVGGDLTSADKLTISISVIGKASNCYLRRSGARAGDKIWVTGNIGSSGLGFKIIEKNLKGKISRKDFYIKKHNHPEPRVKEAIFLANAGVKSMIDISDGLGVDLMHLCQASGLSARIYLDKVPVEDSFYNNCQQLELETIKILMAGEDYELLFSGSEEDLLQVKDEFKKCFNLDFHSIGLFSDGPPQINIVDKNGKMIDIKKYGYQHFSG